jgi:high-affinity nickel-transport protein
MAAMSLLPVLSLGFVLGMTHATDADHVVAVSTIVAERRKLGSAAMVGTVWGLGHTLTVILLGGAVVLFKLVIPPSLGPWLELGVAAMLVALGAHALRASRRSHASRAPWIRTLSVGLVHGVAGSAAIAIGVLAHVDGAAEGLAYLGLFGLGTVAGMMLVTSALALPFAVLTARFARYQRWIRVGAGSMSVALGAALAIKIGFVDGLFIG